MYNYLHLQLHHLVFFWGLFVCLFFFLCHLILLQGRIPSWIWTVWLDQALAVSATMKQPWQWSWASWRQTQTWARLWTLKRCTGLYRIFSCSVTLKHTEKHFGPSVFWWRELLECLLQDAAFWFFFGLFFKDFFNLLVTFFNLSWVVFGWLL